MAPDTHPLDTLPLPTGPAAEVWITWLWHAGLAALALAAFWAVMLALDIFVLPALPRGAWKRPWCWLLGHIEGEDFIAIDGEGFFDVCTRCGHLTPSDED